jgi:transposase
VLAPLASARIYLARDEVDMRKGIDGLRALVQSTLQKNPDEGHVFVFVGKARDKVKVLWWDKNGFALYLKRLERGRFQMPSSSSVSVQMDSTQLAMLLDGIDLNAKRLQRWQPVAPSIARGIDEAGRT